MLSKHYQLSAMAILIVCLLVGAFAFLWTGPSADENQNMEVNYTPGAPVTENTAEPNQGTSLYIPAGQWPTMPAREPNEMPTDDPNATLNR